MCKKEVRKFCIVGLDLVLQSQKITEELGRKNIRYMFHIFNCEGDLIGNFNLSPQEGKMLFEMSVVDIKEGRTTTFFENSCGMPNPSRVKGNINKKFQEFLRAKASLDVDIEIIQNPKGSQSTYKLNCTEYTEPKTFTYSDFLDIFLSPLSRVKIDGQVIEKNALTEEKKLNLFFSFMSRPSDQTISSKLLNFFRFCTNNNGDQIDNSFEAVRGNLKGCLVFDDLIPHDTNGLSTEEQIKFWKSVEDKKKIWETPESSIFTEEKYPISKLSEYRHNVGVIEFIQAEWSATISSIMESDKRFRKWDDFIVGLYCIALHNFKTDTEDDLVNLREDFKRILKRKLKSLFDPDSSDPVVKEKDELHDFIQFIIEKKFLTNEQTKELLNEYITKKYSSNKYESDPDENLDKIDGHDKKMK